MTTPLSPASKHSLVLRGGRIIDPLNSIDSFSDLLIIDGQIASISTSEPAPQGVTVIDVGGKVVCPGFIDIHTHLREPGQEHKETIESGTLAAVRGGFTTVCCMANTNPVNDSPEVTQQILVTARAKGTARVWPIGAVTKGLLGKEPNDFERLSDAGCVAFSDDGRPVMNSALFRHALEAGRLLGKTIIAHEEDCYLSHAASMNEGALSRELGIRGVPAIAEDILVSRDILLSELTGAHVHIAHLSTLGSVRLVRDAKSRGIRVTAEVTPHHLVLTEEEVRAAGTNAKMNPPLRSKRDVEALLEGLVDGTIDCIATDHAPHATSEKEGEFDHAAFGIVGLETAVSVLLDRLVRPGTVALATMVARLTSDPARLLNLPGGSLTPGAAADVTVLDLEARVTVDPKQFRSKSRNTPFGGWELIGAPAMTIVGGAVVTP
jgi:dihydroorotase